MSQEDEILFEVRGGVGIITLNRPQVLNALTLGMIRHMNVRLENWAKDETIRAVVITGAGEKAFCAGGDVKSVAQGDAALKRSFFREEYILNHRIHTFPKPYIALINGIVMGGGKGVSAHGSHCIVSENVMFAMPETNIGFFPDVGGGYFLSRCPGETGVYLALTSKRIKAIDTLYIGFATHFVAANNFTALLDGICAGNVEDAIKKFASPPTGESELAPNRERIDWYFGHDRVEDIIKDLQGDATPWAEETLRALGTMSPTSLKIALKQIQRGAKMSFAEVMTMEYRLSQACMRSHDFYEGIRAALIDKDKNPKWVPATVEGVRDNVVDGYFQSLGTQDLLFPMEGKA